MPCRATVDVVVPTHNARELVLKCVESLSDEAVARITVVDDASVDGTVDALRSRPGVHLVVLERSRGLAHALNRGAAAGNADHILYLNNDVIATPGSIGRLVHALESRADAGSAAGRLVDPASHRTQASYQPRLIPGTGALVARFVGIERAWPANPVTGEHLRAPLPEDRVSVTSRQPAGACLLVRRADHEAVGGWDERFSFWYEDVDYARRLLVTRGPTVYDPEAVFQHVGRASTSSWDKPAQHARLYHGALVYSSLHLRPSGRVAVGITAAVVSLVRVAAYALCRKPTAAATYRRIARQSLAVVMRRRATPAIDES